ncbi:MAG TPA: hypothetical protein VIC26_00395 [Marinagarivorans sp.]
MTFDSKTIVLLAGWGLAALASVALITQHAKWSEAQASWHAELEQKQRRVVELELIIAELHTDIDEGGPTINDATSKTGSAISNVLDRVRNTFTRGGEVPSD